MKQRLADYVADFLAAHGVTDVFSVVGGGAMHLNDALGHHPALHVTYNHHEQASAIAAEAYARIDNKIAALCVTTGPGGTNALTGVVGGWLDSIPMFVISGQVRYDTTARYAAQFTDGLPLRAVGDQEYDITKSVAPMTKYATMLEDPNQIRYVLENAPEEMNFFNSFVDKGLLDRLNHVLNSEFGHVTYTEAVKILEENNDKFDYKVSWGCDLQTEHERYLTEQVFKRPVFVTDYPKEIKAFYMKANEDGKTVAAMDCLVPGIGEIIGGSQREDDYDKLAARMDELGLDKEQYGFYLELRKYGSTHHSGFGLGFERCVMYLTGMGNIRDVIPFPRTVKNCDL